MWNVKISEGLYLYHNFKETSLSIFMYAHDSATSDSFQDVSKIITGSGFQHITLQE
jgi:hypothetical protein